jgi:hypothetical protein
MPRPVAHPKARQCRAVESESGTFSLAASRETRALNAKESRPHLEREVVAPVLNDRPKYRDSQLSRRSGDLRVRDRTLSIGGQHPNKCSLSIRMDTNRQGVGLMATSRVDGDPEVHELGSCGQRGGAGRLVWEAAASTSTLVVPAAEWSSAPPVHANADAPAAPSGDAARVLP